MDQDHFSMSRLQGAIDGGDFGLNPASRQTVVAVEDSAGIALAGRTAQAMARAVGFDETAAGEIAIAATELAGNLHRHAGGGTLSLGPIPGPGLRLEAVDRGPGIPDVSVAMRDGYSTAGGAGLGLGAVNRLMDDLQIDSRLGEGHGTRIACERRVRRGLLTGACPLQVGVASRPCPGREHNGDATVIRSFGESLLVGVIDGLGHGRYAHLAAAAARQYVEAHYDQPLEALFRGTARVCLSTRGVVMALARFDWAARRLQFATIGDVEGRAVGAPRMSFDIRRGILGGQAPSPVVSTHTWLPEWTLVIYSDGVSSHWDAAAIPGFADLPAPEAAVTILLRWAKEADDATVLVVNARRGAAAAPGTPAPPSP